MAYVKLGKTTKSIVEFFVYDNEDKQCGSIYFYGQPETDIIPNYKTIGNIPYDVKNHLDKLQWVAAAELKKS